MLLKITIFYLKVEENRRPIVKLIKLKKNSKTSVKPVLQMVLSFILTFILLLCFKQREPLLSVVQYWTYSIQHWACNL